ncbi:hypothetical protein FNH05_26515 [Amycolatopsis rhizosphaerae]|uniref:DUF7716 domain-containing protein n=1 Tax=Amycolatopsis rhizosphaerae TaxID=2053003 RepID=A0A558BDU7_9PSEU|nr:hypothetical protein [Amycolatopsis rhizosphaerae]TVT34679.1 hypothetical protein FNH05_26515 [Amycolatopsis rhizosphaerae]
MTGTDEARPWLTTWGEVLGALPSLRRSDMVCFGSGPSSPGDGCLVADSADLDEDEDVPPEAAERDWNTALLKEEIEDILGNLRQQIGDPSTELTLRAIAYFVDHDAFLTVG